jgi:hypothetical protein
VAAAQGGAVREKGPEEVAEQTGRPGARSRPGADHVAGQAGSPARRAGSPARRAGSPARRAGRRTVSPGGRRPRELGPSHLSFVGPTKRTN